MSQMGADESGLRNLRPSAFLCGFLLFAGGCSTHVPDPLPATHDASLVGQWVQTGIEAPMVLEFNADGRGRVLVAYEEGDTFFRDLQWGADKTTLGLARPSTDSGLMYEVVQYKVSADGVLTMSDLQRFTTSQEGRIQRSKSTSGFLTRYQLKRRAPRQ